MERSRKILQPQSLKRSLRITNYLSILFSHFPSKFYKNTYPLVYQSPRFQEKESRKRSRRRARGVLKNCNRRIIVVIEQTRGPVCPRQHGNLTLTRGGSKKEKRSRRGNLRRRRQREGVVERRDQKGSREIVWPTCSTRFCYSINASARVRYFSPVSPFIDTERFLFLRMHPSYRDKTNDNEFQATNFVYRILTYKIFS